LIIESITCTGLSGAASWNQARMTVDELEKLQFLAAEKARQVLSYNHSSRDNFFMLQ